MNILEKLAKTLDDKTSFEEKVDDKKPGENDVTEEDQMVDDEEMEEEEEPEEEEVSEEESPEEEIAAEPTGTDPVVVGAEAAKAFIGPELMEAASSGDQGAKDLVARTAGEIAGAVTRETANSQSIGAGGEVAAEPVEEEMPVEEEEVPEEGEEIAAQPEETQEDAIANQIVPNKNAVAASPVVKATP